LLNPSAHHAGVAGVGQQASAAVNGRTSAGEGFGRWIEVVLNHHIIARGGTSRGGAQIAIAAARGGCVDISGRFTADQAQATGDLLHVVGFLNFGVEQGVHARPAFLQPAAPFQALVHTQLGSKD
jgi:hypothetical protein